MATPIENYAVIGDGRTCALISRTGDLDWLCLPDLDSSASFAALLGGEQYGRWSVTIDDGEVTSRSYVKATFILVTEYRSPEGTARITEWMPIDGRRNDVVRRVECTSGHVTVRQHLRVRFGYGRIVPWASQTADPENQRVLHFVAGPDSLTLHAPSLPAGHDRKHENHHQLSEGERLDLTLTWTRSWDPLPTKIDVDASLENTRKSWQNWCASGEVDELYDSHVRRSLLTLRLLTNFETGGIAAAATTSLPEEFGGVRNWDYRFCWLRDSALTLHALLTYGFVEEAQAWRDWLLRAVAGDPHDLQIMYGIDGGRYLPEYELPHLPGYAGSRPVRIGNAASEQVQHDVYGEVLGALAVARDNGIVETSDSWSLQAHLVNGVAKAWREPDHGIWEIRGEKRHFTQSKVMSWVALDRAISALERYDLPGPHDEWVAVREEIRSEVLTRGVDPVSNSFVQHYDTTEVDASLLMILQTGFLPPTDERVKNTVDRIRDELSDGPHVMRYRTETGVDGLPGKEHHFFACSFWLVDALAQIGEFEEAKSRFDALITTGNELGLFAEEYDVQEHRFAGNFPQALSHLALVRAAHALDESERATTES